MVLYLKISWLSFSPKAFWLLNASASIMLLFPLFGSPIKTFNFLHETFSSFTDLKFLIVSWLIILPGFVPFSKLIKFSNKRGNSKPYSFIGCFLAFRKYIVKATERLDICYVSVKVASYIWCLLFQPFNNFRILNARFWIIWYL